MQDHYLVWVKQRLAHASTMNQELSGLRAIRNMLAYLDVPTLAQPETFLQYKDGFFDADGSVGAASKKFLQAWMDAYVAWVKGHQA